MRTSQCWISAAFVFAWDAGCGTDGLGDVNPDRDRFIQSGFDTHDLHRGWLLEQKSNGPDPRWNPLPVQFGERQRGHRCGPNTTNNINLPSIVSDPGANSGVLTMTLPSLVDTFGYGLPCPTGAAPFSTARSFRSSMESTRSGSLSYTATPTPLPRRIRGNPRAHSHSTGSRSPSTVFRRRPSLR
jgi:hypothetical protein